MAKFDDVTTEAAPGRRGRGRWSNRLAAGGLAVVLGLGLGACGEGGDLSLPSGGDLPDISLPDPSIDLPEGGGAGDGEAGAGDAGDGGDAGAGDAGDGGEAAQPEEPQEPEPDPQPEEEPASEETQTDTSAEDAAGEDGTPAWLWPLLAVLALVGLVAWFVQSRRSRQRREPLLANLHSQGRWVIDTGTGALMAATDAGSTQVAWNQLNSALVTMASDASTLSRISGGEIATAALATRDAVTALQGAADAHARSQLGGQTGPSTGSSTGLAIFEARDRLAGALEELPDPRPS